MRPPLVVQAGTNLRPQPAVVPVAQVAISPILQPAAPVATNPSHQLVVLVVPAVLAVMVVLVATNLLHLQREELMGPPVELIRPLLLRRCSTRRVDHRRMENQVISGLI